MVTPNIPLDVSISDMIAEELRLIEMSPRDTIPCPPPADMEFEVEEVIPILSPV